MIINIIHKYLSNEASEKEVQTLFDWIEASEDNKKQFISLKKAWILTAFSEGLPTNNASAVPIHSKKKSSQYFKYAAILLFFLGLAKILFDFNQKVESSKEIVLDFGNGHSELITKTNLTAIVNDKGDLIAKKMPNQIIYFGKVKNEEVLYHTLKVPYGKTFKITLSDGTLVSLNAGTTLRYPQQFGINGKRNVFLNGEAFFEVAKDKLHPFIVNANEVDIEVLGTKFNVNAYPETATVSSVLVEGSVKITQTVNPLNTVLLAPNQMATWEKISKKMTTQTVDTDIYSAWTKGELAFKDTPFATIVSVIQRTYDVEIINNNSNLDKQHFTGTIKISDSSVKDILDILKLDTPFEYSINKNVVTINNTH